MKRLIIIVFSLLLLSGCKVNTGYVKTNTDEKIVVPVIQTEGERPADTIAFNKISKIEYDGHRWVVFEKATFDGYIYDVEHDPNCWCMIDYD